MFLNIKTFINPLILIIVAILILPLQASAHKHKEHHSKAEQTEVKSENDSYQLAIINPAPGFALIDVNGKVVNLKDLRGKIKIINFIYTYCPDICPLTTGELSTLQGMLKKERLLGGEVEMISVSIDPERDTPQQLKKYASGFKADSNGWLFLRGTDKQTKKVLSDYDIWSKKQADGTIDHVMRVYLIDGKDRIREIYNLAFLQPELVVQDIEMILNEKE